MIYTEREGVIVIDPFFLWKKLEMAFKISGPQVTKEEIGSAQGDYLALFCLFQVTMISIIWGAGEKYRFMVETCT